MRQVEPIVLACAAVAGLFAASLAAQPQGAFDDAGDARAALATAQAQGETARQRAVTLEAEAGKATAAADKTAREAAAIAARIQQSEAALAASEARILLISDEQSALQARLAVKQAPLVRLTGALQRLARRPVVLSLLRPGSVRDTMHLRALLETMLPEIERRTAGLRAELAQGRALQRQAEATRRDLSASQAELARRRTSLAGLETRQRLASRDASGVADRESERALALAEAARDLGALTQSLDAAGALRSQLAALPGPVMRPERPDLAQVAEPPSPSPSASLGLAGYVLPVDGRLVAGFGEVREGLPQSRGVVLAPRGGAQAVAPAAGRVAFAGPYRGYGRIVIVQHPGGWTSVVMGLASLSVRVGDELVAGAPLGSAGPVRPLLTVELRKDGQPVNPLDLVRRS
ncbi:MAG: murein hydrolase activator EnvC family protein [Novosphingobium sp.]